MSNEEWAQEHNAQGRRQREWRSTAIGLLRFRLPPRDRDEVHRGSTSLELMFDLATVVAVSTAAHGLAQEVENGNVTLGTIKFLCTFFMAWLAWMNYTWFASAYDNKSTAFRTLSMVIMFGSLTLAAGIRGAFGDQPIWLVLVGFIIMRFGMIALWLGAANGDRDMRPTALRYAAGIGILQVYWNLLIAVVSPQASLYIPLFMLGAAGELLVPVLAEQRSRTSWHHGHIVDRYNSFNIIVLGECFASIVAIISDSSPPDLQHFRLAGLCSVIAFSMWRLYFDRNKQLLGRDLGAVLLWSYGHYVLFAAGAATAAGFAIFLAVIGKHAQISAQSACLAVAIPIAVYLGSLWLVRDRPLVKGTRRWLLVAAGVLVLASSTFANHLLELIAAVLVITVIVRDRLPQVVPGKGDAHN